MQYSDFHTSTQITQLLRESAGARVFFEVDASTPIRVCTGPFDAQHSGNTYRGDLGLSFQKMSMESPASVICDNSDHWLSATQFADSQGSFSSYDAYMYFYLLSEAGSWTHVNTWTWVVKNTAWSPTHFRFYLKVGSLVRKRACLSICSSRCDLIFKGYYCGYSGSDTTCEHTWDDCSSKSNTSRFRGCRAAPNAGDVVDLPDIGRGRVVGPQRTILPPGGGVDSGLRSWDQMARMFITTDGEVSEFFDAADGWMGDVGHGASGGGATS